MLFTTLWISPAEYLPHFLGVTFAAGLAEKGKMQSRLEPFVNTDKKYSRLSIPL